MSLLLGSEVNIKRSIDKYLFDNIYTTEGIPIDFEGIKFDQVSNNEWIQPRIVNIQSVFRRQSSSTQYGEDTNILFQINIFVKKGHQTTSDRNFYIRDIVLHYFKFGQQITIYDYDGDLSSIGNMTVRNISDDFALEERQNIYQYVVSWEIDLTRHYTKTS